MTDRGTQAARDDAFEQATVDSFAGYCQEHGLDSEDAYRLAGNVTEALYGVAERLVSR